MHPLGHRKQGCSVCRKVDTEQPSSPDTAWAQRPVFQARHHLRGCFLFSLVRIETVWKHILDRDIAPRMLRALLSWAYKESKENLGLSVLGCTDLDQKLLLTHSSRAKHRSVKGALLVHSQDGHGLDREDGLKIVGTDVGFPQDGLQGWVIREGGSC